MFMGMMKQAFPDVLGRPEAKQLFKFLDYSEYGGAPLLGVKGVVIICHGASPARAIMSAVRVAAHMVESHLDQDIGAELAGGRAARDRKSTRLNSSHGYISYAVFCLKKKKQQRRAASRDIVRRASGPDRTTCPSRFQ